MIANGTEGATVRIDAYSTTNNDSLTYRILNGSVLPLQYDEYISVVRDQLVIASVPEELLPASIFIDVCRMCMIVLQDGKWRVHACMLILCSDLSHRKLSIILIIFFVPCIMPNQFNSGVGKSLVAFLCLNVVCERCLPLFS